MVLARTADRLPVAGVSHWTAQPIRELCSAIIDCVNKTAPSVPGPTPYRMIRTTNVRHGRVNLDDVRYVEEDVYRRWVRRGEPIDGDIVLTREAPLGEVGMLRNARGVFLGQRLVMYRANPDRADRHFLLYAMRAPGVQAQIKAFGSGATVEHMRVPDCGELLIECPRLSDQRRIGRILAAFDELIEVNERRIELLENLARSIYREWFVRFRAPGHPDELPNATPGGWTRRTLFEIAEVGFGYSFRSTGFSDAGSRPVVRIRDVPKGTTETFSEEIAPERYAVRDHDVLIGMDGEFYVNQWSGGDAWLNQRVARLRPKKAISARLLMLAVEAPVRSWNEAISGTTVAHLGKRHLETIQLLIPPDPVLQEATRIFEALAEPHLLLLKLNRRLATTRDLLLPRLVSGRLDVADVDLGELLPTERE